MRSTVEMRIWLWHQCVRNLYNACTTPGSCLPLTVIFIMSVHIKHCAWFTKGNEFSLDLSLVFLPLPLARTGCRLEAPEIHWSLWYQDEKTFSKIGGGCWKHKQNLSATTQQRWRCKWHGSRGHRHHEAAALKPLYQSGLRGADQENENALWLGSCTS